MSIQVDPSDARRLCLCGEQGSLIVLRLVDLDRERCACRFTRYLQIDILK